MTQVARVHVRFPGSMFQHWFVLLSGGKVLRSTDGVGVETDCGTFPELRTKDDLVAKVTRQGYEVIE